MFRFILLFTLSCTCAFGQFENDLQNLVEDYKTENNIRGISAAVHFDDGRIWQGTAGTSHEEVSMDTSMYMGIASNTKLFTAVLSLMMIENGFYQLDDPVSKWLEDIPFVDPQITVRQLLQHHSGLNDFIGNQELFPGLVLAEPTRIWTPSETLEYLLEPISTPGEGVYYSNTNFILAAMIMESATGLRYNDLLQDSLLTPLGLNEIYLEGYEDVPSPIAHPHLLGNDLFATERTALGTITWSAGYLVSRPKAIVQWYHQVFNEQYFSEFVINNVTDFIEWEEDIEEREMGMGVYFHTINDSTYYGHGGNTIGYASYTLYDLECGHSTSVISNELFSDAYSLAVLLAEKACSLTNMGSSTSEIDRNYHFFPVPATTHLHLPDATQISLYNSFGERVAQNLGESIELLTLANGTYIACGTIDQTTQCQKVLVIK